MMRPPRGSCAFMMRMASWAQRNGTGEVHGDYGAPLLERQVFHGDRGRAGSGVIEEEVQAAEGVQSFLKESLDAGWVSYVGRDGEDVGGGRASQGSGFFELVGAASGEGYGIAGSVEGQGYRPADSASGACYEGCFWGHVWLTAVTAGGNACSTCLRRKAGRGL
jgi:hypothetical protein